MSTRLAGRAPRTPREAFIVWARIAEPGDRRLQALDVWADPLAALDVVLSGSTPEHDRFRVRAGDVDLEQDQHIADRLGLRILTAGDAQWPRGVDDLKQPPLCLWVRGNADLAQVLRRSVAVVGSRASTSYGRHVAGELGIALAERGFTVVSGAALGIDTAAHDGVLVAGGTTVAVLAGGADRAYPASNAPLLARIAETGAVVSEMPPGSAPTKPRFLSRNRLIAAMTPGTVVVEAGWRSGALSTARAAERVLRPVGAVPGPVTSALSAGTNEAIRSGLAVCVTDADEVAELVGRLGDDLAPPRTTLPLLTDDLDDDEQRVLSALPVRRAASVDNLCRTAGLSIREVSRVLGKLALLALAEQGPDGGWRRAPM